MKHTALWTAFLSLSLLASCKKATVAVGVANDRTIQAHGISYRVPWETSSVGDTPWKFSYEGESVTISEEKGQLTVDGKKYGTVKAGDTVSVPSKGTVLVNDTPRTAE